MRQLLFVIWSRLGGGRGACCSAVGTVEEANMEDTTMWSEERGMPRRRTWRIEYMEWSEGWGLKRRGRPWREGTEGD